MRFAGRIKLGERVDQTTSMKPEIFVFWIFHILKRQIMPSELFSLHPQSQHLIERSHPLLQCLWGLLVLIPDQSGAESG